MMNQLFNKYDVVKGYYLDEMELDYLNAPSKLVYVSKYDESISVNILEDIYDILMLDVMNLYEYDSEELADKLTEMVEQKVIALIRKLRK